MGKDNQQTTLRTYSTGYKLLFLLLFMAFAISAVGQEKYEVVSVLKLNVRSRQTTKSSIIGKLSRQDTIDVYSIVNSWAKINFKNRTAYVSSKYLKKVEIKEEPVIELVEEEIIPILEAPVENETSPSVLDKEPVKESYLDIDFVPSIYGGYTNFASDNASPKGNIGFGVDFAFQFIANQRIKFVPKNYYMEASLGYSCKGSGAFPMHYITLKLSPIGYRYKFSDYMLFCKIGAYAGYTFSTIETSQNSFDSNIDIGMLGGIGIEYKKIGIGVSYERGFTNVCNSNLKLNNQCIFLNLSYRLFNLK